MAEFVAGSYIAAASGTTPTHQVGDLLIVVAVRWASTTIPSLPSGWTSVFTSSSTYGRRIGWKVATATNDSTGTWTTAEDLYVAVWRGFDVGAVASNASGTNAQVPALTLTSAPSWVGVLCVGGDSQPGTPTGTTSRWVSSYERWSDTNGTVSSWTAQTMTDLAVTASIELVPTVTDVTGSLAASWDIAGYVTGSLAASWEVKQLEVTGSLAASWKVESTVTASLAASWDVLSVRNWRDTAASAEYLSALADPHRLESARAEIVDLSGASVEWLDESTGEPIECLFEQADVEFSGEVPESWSLRSCTITDPTWVPRDPTHPLDPRSQVAIKFWHRLWVEDLGGWVDVPVGVYRPTRPRISDGGNVSVSFSGRDLLSVAMQGGYGGQVVDVGGMTVDAALRRVFDTVAPALTFQAPETTITLPTVYELGREKPFDDWTAIAEIAGWVVRADREGVITAGPQPDPSSVTLTLTEGDDCPVRELSREISETLYNRVVVISTHPDLTAPVVGMDEDNDPGSPTYVGLGNVRELTIESDVPTTVQAANNMAAMHLGKYIRPTESVSVTIPPWPVLEYRDLIALSRAQSGVAGDYRVSKWSLSLPVNGKAPSLMDVTMMSRQVAR